MAENVEIKFDLDTKEALEKLFQLNSSVTGLGKEENVAGLVEGLLKVGEVAGVLGAAFFVLKGTMDAVFEAENIKAINAQFEILTENAGISTETLKKGLEKSAAGLMTETELLQSANKAIVTMGSSASKLPELMELARKSTAIFGGDLQTNFENINQAIAAGNVRMLKHAGIVIDVNKAVKAFADAHGMAANELSNSARQQAIMNAALQYGQDRMAGINPELKENQNAWQRITVAMKELKETFDLMIASWVASDAGKKVSAGIMSGLAAIKGSFQSLTKEAHTTKDAISELHDEQMKGRAESGKSPVVAEDLADQQKRLENQKKFAAEKLKIEQDINKNLLDNAYTEEDLNKALDQRKLLAHEELSAKLKEIDSENTLNATQKEELKTLAVEQNNEKIKALDADMLQVRTKFWDNYAKHSTSTMDGISRGYKAALEKDKLQLNNFAATGTRAYDGFKKHATDAFLAVGAGQESVGEAMKDIALNVVADEAQARGSLLMATSIFPPNPIGLAAGAGLLALAGFLRSQTKSGGSGAGAPSVGGGGGGDYSNLASGNPSTDAGQVAAKAEPKKTVNLNIGGNYYDNAQSRQELAQIVRDNLDTTDFNIKRIGES